MVWPANHVSHVSKLLGDGTQNLILRIEALFHERYKVFLRPWGTKGKGGTLQFSNSFELYTGR